MLQPLQIQDVSARYPQEIAELRDFLAKAGLRLDTPGTLHEVAAGLREDRALRRDLTSHLWVALHAGGPQVRHADLLAMLAIAAAGQQLAAEAADADAHDLLRFVLHAWKGFDAPATDRPRLHSALPVDLAPQPVAASSFTRNASPAPEASLAFDMPEDAESHRQIAWISAGVCAVAVLLAGLLLHRHAATNPGAPAPVVADSAPQSAPDVMATRGQGQSGEQHFAAPRTGPSAPAVRSEARPAPYSRLSDGPEDLPSAAAPTHAKPSPAIPLAPTPRSVASSRPAARPYARSPRSYPTMMADAAAGGDSNYVPKVTPVDNFKTRGAPLSVGSSRQATVRPTSLGIMAANVTYSPAPAYPPAATAARVQGEVKLEAEVGRDGTVESTRVISGPPLLADAAADAVQHWRYRPYLYEGRPVAMNAQIVMDFQLP